MKRTLILGLMLVGLSTAAWAGTADEAKLETEAIRINKEASSHQGAVVSRLEKEFKVDGAVIQGLRDKKLGYGEIAITLSLAGKMPGGITPDNINKILDMRNSTPRQGWGEIAHKLGTKIGNVAEHVEKVRHEAHEDAGHEKHAGKEHLKNEHRPEEKAERLERAEKVQRPERVERPEKAARR